MAGFVFGVAALARLTVIFGAPFFLFVGPGGSMFKRGDVGRARSASFRWRCCSSTTCSRAATSSIRPTTTSTTPSIWATCRRDLQIDTSYGIEDIRHIPLNLLIMFGWLPDYAPMGTDCGLAWLNPDCPVLRPSQIGMSVLLTSPAYLLAVPLVIRHWRKRIVTGATLAVIAIAFVNLMHFSQGWVQFGYRFSNDLAPFALVLVTLAIARYGVRMLTVGLVAAVGAHKCVGRLLGRHTGLVSSRCGRVLAARLRRARLDKLVPAQHPCALAAHRSARLRAGADAVHAHAAARRGLLGHRRVPGPRARCWASRTRPATRPTRCCCGSRPSCSSRSATPRYEPTCSPRCSSPARARSSVRPSPT